jgi:EmrB/QacA subfamily drug resistance transporter
VNQARNQRTTAPSSAPSVHRVLAIVSAAAFMTALDLFIVNIAFPDIRRDFAGASLSSLSWVLNAYAIIFAALLVPAGRVADRIGQKRGFLAGLMLFTAASALCAVANSPEVLIGARVLQAAGAAAVTPTSLAILLGAVPIERRSWALGVWTAVSAIAAALGPSVGGVLVTLGWRWVFLVNLPIGIIATLLAFRVLADDPGDATGKRPDLLGAGLLTAGIAALSLGIVQGPEWGWGSLRILGAFALFVITIGWFAYRSGHHPSPIVEPQLLRVRTFVISSVAAFFFNAAFAIMLLGLVQFMTGIWGYSALRTGLAIAPGPMAVPFVATYGPKLVQRIGAPLVGLIGSSLFAIAGLSWYVVTGFQPNYLAEFLPGLILAGIGFGLTLPVLLTTAARSLPAQRFGTGSAVVTMARQIGAVLGVSLLIVLLDNAGTDILGAFHRGWLVLGLASLVAGVLCLGLRVDPRPLPGSTGERLPDPMAPAVEHA